MSFGGAVRVEWAVRAAGHVDDRPRFLLKGGAYLELKLGLRSRATKDVDTLFRGDFDEFVETLDAALGDALPSPVTLMTN